MSKTRKITLASIAAITLCASTVVYFEGDKAVGYADPVGIATAGSGHTGPDVVIGKWYDKATREGWLQGDLEEAALTVERCAPGTIDVYQRAAYISFAFNVGPGRKGVKDGFCVLKSGKIPTHIRKARAGDKAGSCNALLAWDKAGGKTLKGLTRRRKAERDLCLMAAA
ncbi:lysozyme [Oxalobacter formigenes]|uniref:lysozyme n=1 Tax=Oxalobacter formigenes TaxID=847 RepID=UPI000A29F0D9|nr:lysozyme [Oxalobacter formigenes]ARQ46071.1 Lysozyme RrrD [Oxalobacter formigenes]MCZ4063700.1 lysozyme [Oxalobacter formigenes]QDX33192.1 lysozyme [Oxalobacter formigenes]